MQTGGGKMSTLDQLTDSEQTAGEEVSSGRNLMYAMRIVHRSQTLLVGLADRKANALIGIMMVVFSILLAKSDLMITLPLSLKLLLGAFFLSEVLAVCFALLVILPKNVASSSCTDMVRVGNPLFFGFYTQCSQAEFIQYLFEEFESDVRARELLLADYYQVGCVLKKKYRLLRKAYLSAAIGMLLLCGLLVSLLFAGG
jgi:hypothetical protein